MSRLLAYCGIDCAQCPVYVATSSGDEAEKEKIAKEWSSDAYPLTAADVHCQGCCSGGELISFCAGCDIRSCAVESEQESCAFCPSYPCAKLEKQSPESLANLEDRKRGLSSKQVIDAALNLLSDAPSMVATTVDSSGFPRSRALLKTRFDGLRQIVFTTSNQSEKVAQLRHNNKVAIYVPDYASFRALTLWGTMEVLEDRYSKASAWVEGFERYYPEGIDTPWLCVLRFTALGGQYYQGRPYELIISQNECCIA